MRLLILLVSSITLISCQHEENESNLNDLSIQIQPKYANGFMIEKHHDYNIVTINNPWNKEQTAHKYILYKDKEPTGFKDALKIKIPITRLVCMSLTHIAFVDAIGKESSIIGTSGINFTHNNKLLKRFEKKEVVDIGSEQSINYELLVEKSPDIVMAYGIDDQSLKYLNKFKKIGLKAILNAEYMETHPLGKAEWIKFVAAFYDELDLADSLFKKIENDYLALLSITDTISKKPTVFVGMPWNGNWYVAGGKSFQAQLFKDAGADYIWQENNDMSSLVKSKELVLDEALNADYWLNQNNYHSISAILEYDQRLVNFKSIKSKSLFNNSNRTNIYGGNDYWESATINPQIVLKDLIEIFHPNILQHELYYYKKLH